MNNLTKIASLPGSGAGCMSSLPAEKNEAIKVQMKAEYFQEEPLPKIKTIEEFAKEYLAACQGSGC